ncbi:hypothetical protein ACLB2K_002757 [Fragaria x ananassa]
MDSKLLALVLLMEEEAAGGVNLADIIPNWRDALHWLQHIGSLGKSGNVVQVENVHVSKVTLQGTTNGARIKTWQVGQGNVRGVRFEDFFLDSVKNPIIIDQNYCKVRGACEELPTGGHISDVSFKNFYGTSSTNIAINLKYSLSVPCTEILMKSIYLRSAIAGKNVTSSCRNAYGIDFGVVHPSPCFQI